MTTTQRDPMRLHMSHDELVELLNAADRAGVTSRMLMDIHVVRTESFVPVRVVVERPQKRRH